MRNAVLHRYVSANSTNPQKPNPQKPIPWELFIQSAGLRGPFGEGWVNPWAREKRKRGKDDTKRRLEIANDDEESHAVGLEVGKTKHDSAGYTLL